jgi:signal transduction histidine kinase
MADRWPVILEAFGLIAALEDLAERVEADARLAIQIDVGRAAGRPPVAVERAAGRVAQIAVDNAVRHGAPSSITIAVSVEPDRVGLAITDDGRGFDPSAVPANRPLGRGLADARAKAGSVGASLLVDARPGGGSTVTLRWTPRGGRPE